MKKLIATLLIAMIAFAAFAGISVTMDTIAQYAGPNDPAAYPEGALQGFTIKGADEYIFADMNASLSKGPATALLNIRFRMPDQKYYGDAVEIHGWNISARVTDWLKLSVGNTPYEIFAESVGWEPIGGAGLFEQGKNRLYFDMQFDDLQIITGLSMGQDNTKPWNTLQAAVVYEIPMTVKLAAEFSMVSNLMSVSTGNTDGEIKTFSFQADYIGTENLDALLGYTLTMVEGGGIVQHRADIFATYFTEKFGIEFYDAFLYRCVEGETFGNRLGIKFSYYLNETLTPYVKANWFKNYGLYGTQGGFAWGDCQILGPGTDPSLIVLDAGLGFVVTDNLSGSIGGVFKFVKDGDAFWSIPLCLTATF